MHMDNIFIKNIAGVIIMGGKNTRMNGQKKAFLEYKGKAFYEHILEALYQTDTVFLSVEEYAPYRDIGLSMIVDEIKDIGPISGLYSLMKNLDYDAYVVLPSDTPKVSKELVDSMIDLYKKHNKTVVSVDKGKFNPLIAVYKSDCLVFVKQMIENKNYRLRDLFKNVDYVEFDVDKLGFFEEIEDYDDFESYGRL